MQRRIYWILIPKEQTKDLNKSKRTKNQKVHTLTLCLPKAHFRGRTVIKSNTIGVQEDLQHPEPLTS